MTGLLDQPRRLISADDVCHAVETTLRAGVPALLEHLVLTETYGEIKEWQQVPDLDALTSANVPAVAITSPGLTGAPTRSGSGEYTATWRIGVGVYDRGADHQETQKRARDWCAFIRTVLLGNRTLGGFAETLTWAGEEYARLRLRGQARTLAGGSVAVDVRVANVVDVLDLGPVVTSTYPSLRVQTSLAPPIEEN